MGQIFQPAPPGISVRPIDRQSGPAAGAGASGNRSIFLGSGAGLNSAISNFIAIGNGTAGNGINDTANLNGSTIIGQGSAPFVKTGAGTGIPITVLGSNNLQQFNSAANSGIDSTVIVGSTILNGGTAANMSTSVYMGTNLFPNASIFPATTKTVVIGNRINTPAADGHTSIANNTVMIGTDLFTTGYNSQYSSSVIIGASINGSNTNGVIMGPNVVIGTNIGLSAGPTGCVVIGPGSTYGGSANAASVNNVILGPSISYSGSSNTVIGNGAAAPPTPLDASVGNVIIGAHAGTTVPSNAAFNNLLVIESSLVDGGAPSTLIYGFFSNGNLILGNSTQGINRDLPALTNCLKLINSTVTTVTTPVGGGYFYVLAGALHWKGSAGTDTVVAPA